MRRALIALLCAATFSAQAETPTPRDFAYGLNLETTGEGPIFEVTLPQKIYQGVTRTDLRDLRVFNGQGSVLPHALRQAAQTKQVLAPIALPVFPLYESKRADAASLSLHIQTDAKGAIVDVNTGREKRAQGEVQAYVIDASALTQIPGKLLLEWDAPEQGFAATVSVEYSQDLNHWQPLVAATVADIRYGGRALSQRVIDLPLVQARYLRLQWPANARDVRIVSVRASFPDVLSQQPRQWLRVPGQRVAESKPAAAASRYEFDTSGFFPIDRLRVQLPQRNTFIEATLLSRASAQEPWRERYRGALYQLQMQGAMVENTLVQLPVSSDRYWRLEVNDSAGGLGGGVPDIEFAWVPQQLLFVARGAAPFTIAYGSRRVITAPVSVEPMFADIETRASQGLIQRATVGGFVTLGGAQQLQLPPPPLPWKAWLLWAALVLGVLVLAFMVWRLAKQMNAAPPNS